MKHVRPWSLTRSRAVVAAAVVLPLTALASPTLALAGLVLLAALVAVLDRVEWALLLVVALAPFDDLLAAQVHPQTTKAVGALLFGALLVRAYSSRDRIPTHVANRCLTAFALLALLASVAHDNGATGAQVLLRYLSFFGVYLACLVVFRDLRWLARALAVYVLSSTAAALVGLNAFLYGASSRAEGPLEDPNDLAFVLVVAVPLAVALARRSGRRAWYAAAAVCVVGAAATVSRGGALALLVLLVWGLATGLLRVRTALTAAAASAVLVGGVALAFRARVESALEQKAYIAGTNVDTRFERWRASLAMTGDHPLLGLGPAGFRLNYDAYSVQYDPTSLPLGTVAHQMFLEVAAEFGLPALLAFTAFVVLAALSARDVRSSPDADPDLVLLAAAVEGGLLAVLSCALFLTEQYYLPLWFLCAAAVALHARAPARRGADRGDDALEHAP